MTWYYGTLYSTFCRAIESKDPDELSSLATHNMAVIRYAAANNPNANETIRRLVLMTDVKLNT